MVGKVTEHDHEGELDDGLTQAIFRPQEFPRIEAIAFLK
jgi:hypothetical protein